MSESPVVIGFDFETEPISARTARPKPVCVSLAGRLDNESIELRGFLLKLLPTSEQWYTERDGCWAIVARPVALKLALEWAEANDKDNWLWVAHNLPFDLQVYGEHLTSRAEVFRLIETGRFRDTMTRDALWAIATDNWVYDGRVKNKKIDGRFSLAHVVKARFDVDMVGKGEDSWRVNYNLLSPFPICDWPLEALEYSALDSVWAVQVFEDQAKDGVIDSADGPSLINELPQTLSDQALSYLQVCAPSLDPDRVDLYEDGLRKKAQVTHNAAYQGGWLKLHGCRACEGTSFIGEPPNLRECTACDGGANPPRAKPKSWSNSSKARLEAWVSHAYQGRPPTTPSGKPSTKVIDLESCGLPLLEDYAGGLKASKALDRQVPLLRKGVEAGVLIAGFNNLVRSGRTSSFGPNLQNPDSKGLFRSCFVARPGNVFNSTDYSTLELFSWAQVCLDLYGYSTMANALNEGVDVHCKMGRAILRSTYGIDLSYEDFFEAAKLNPNHKYRKECKAARKIAKVPNFGCPGMMTKPQTLCEYAKGMDVDMTPPEAESYINLWRETWAESQAWLRDLQRRAPYGKTFTIRQQVSGRVRAGCISSSGANSYFQGRAADFAKRALYRVVRASLAEPESPLYGCRPWNFIHDEIIVEGPQDTVDAWSAELKRLMLVDAPVYFPDVYKNMEAEEAISVRWEKGAETTKTSDGKLIPWDLTEPELAAALPQAWLNECRADWRKEIRCP